MSEQSENEMKDGAMIDTANQNPLGLSAEGQKMLAAHLNYSLAGEGLDMSIGAGYAVSALLAVVLLFVGVGGAVYFGLVLRIPEGFFCLLALGLLIFPYAVFSMTRNLSRARKA